MNDDLTTKPDSYWKERLTDEQFRVLRLQGTEAPGSGHLLYNESDGYYTCAGCGTRLFKSDAKYESTMPGLIGWPSFSEMITADVATERPDNSLGERRTEVICKTCGGHLGHLFDDETSPNGKHYCINSAALSFTPEKND